MSAATVYKAAAGMARELEQRAALAAASAGQSADPYGELGDAQRLAAELVEILARSEPEYRRSESAARDAVRARFGLPAQVRR